MHILKQESILNDNLRPIRRPILSNEINAIQERMYQLEKTVQDLHSTAPERVPIKSNKGYHLVCPQKIIRCEAEGNYSFIHLICGAKYCVSQTLKSLETSLQGYNFFRCHQSHLVNSEHVLIVSLTHNHLELLDGNQIPISRNNKDRIKSILLTQK